MTDANTYLSNLDSPTQVKESLIPMNTPTDKDHILDLGTASRRWRKLFLCVDQGGVGGAELWLPTDSAKIWELASQGITRSDYEGRAFVMPGEEFCDRDYVGIAFPRALGDRNYVIQLTGGAAGWHSQPTPAWPVNNLYVYADWYVVSINEDADGFIAWVTYTVYSARYSDEEMETPDPLIHSQIDSFNSWAALLLRYPGVSGITQIPAELGDVHWLVRWPL